MCLPLKPFAVEREWPHMGLLCAVVMNMEGGHRCGYVRVGPSRPDHGKYYNDVDVSVHGGLTFGELEPCAHEDGQGFWFGFDCAHCDDAAFDPKGAMNKYNIHALNLHYWTTEEVVRETNTLAEQLAHRR